MSGVLFGRTSALVFLLLTAACGSASSAGDGGLPDASADGGADAGTSDTGERPRYLTSLEGPDDLATLTSTIGGGVKYLARVAGKPAFEPLEAPCYFQDMRRYSWHLEFLRSFPELAALAYDAYLSLVLKASSRVLWGGAVEAWAGAIHPATGRPGVLAYTIYASPGELDEDDLVAAHARLAPCIPFAEDLLVFVPEAPDQRALVSRARADLAARGVATLFPEDLLRGLDHVAYSRGEGYGILRVVPRGQALTDYGPRDVVIVESAPNDISVVSGLITATPQNALGHVNLRLREKAIPNAAAPNIYEASWIATLAGHLVHLVVTDAALTVEPARLADAQAFWDAHHPHVPAPEADLSVTALRDFHAITHADHVSVGVKAANLGELRHFLAPPSVNEGFAIPFSRYRDFAASIGLPAELDAFLADPRVETDAAFVRGKLDTLRKKLKRAPFPPALLADLEAEILATFGPGAGTLKLRFRSSTNVEDLEVFTGAGLYESKTGCLADDLDGDELGPSRCLTDALRADLEQQLAARQAEYAEHPERSWLPAIIADLEDDLTNEKPVADAVRKVWASLWNDRAFDERTYYGIDHRLAFMGIGVTPSFQVERATGVVVTNLHPDDGLPLYRVNSQAGQVSVVRPEDPTAVSELFTFRRAGDQARDLGYQSYSSLAPPMTPLWPDPALADLVEVVFRVHDHFIRSVYSTLEPPRLDLELKLTAEGEVVVKQVRPYVSRDPTGQ